MYKKFYYSGSCCNSGGTTGNNGTCGDGQDSTCTCGTCSGTGGTSRDKYTGRGVLTFYRSEILYDVKNYAYVEADIRKTDDEHDRHQVFDIAEDGNIDRCTRVMNLAFAEAEEMLYPFTKEQISDTEEQAFNDILREPDTYTMRLKLPSKFSLTTLRLLRELLHEFIVIRVLSDWLSITYPEAAEVWLAKLEDLRERIKKALFARTGSVYRKLSPF